MLHLQSNDTQASLGLIRPTWQVKLCEVVAAKFFYLFPYSISRPYYTVTSLSTAQIYLLSFLTLHLWAWLKNRQQIPKDQQTGFSDPTFCPIQTGQLKVHCRYYEQYTNKELEYCILLLEMITQKLHSCFAYPLMPICPQSNFKHMKVQSNILVHTSLTACSDVDLDAPTGR